jgi:glycosyltransferase involved in cell wall biosynthesis
MSIVNPIRARIVCRSLDRGGAARATRRILEALTRHGPASRVSTDAWALDNGQFLPATFSARARRALSRGISSVRDYVPTATGHPVLHSRADTWTGLGAALAKTDADIINLHWIGTGTLAIEEIAQIRKPIVWTLHDMWAFCGAEHYAKDERFVHGYRRGNRAEEESGYDWNRNTWRRKVQSWRSPMHIVAPSRWMADAAGRSALMHDWPVSVIPNPVETEIWRPADRAATRTQLGLPSKSRLILFGAEGGESFPIKGADLLLEALRALPAFIDEAQSIDEVELVVFGGPKSWVEPPGRTPFRVHHLGRISDDHILGAVYSAADVMVVPSRQDNLPNTAMESQACGTPVVAFDVGGISDIVEDGVTGRLVTPFDVGGLARAIAGVLNSRTGSELGAKAARRMVEQFSPQRVASMYAEVFHEHSAAANA